IAKFAGVGVNKTLRPTPTGTETAAAKIAELVKFHQSAAFRPRAAPAFLQVGNVRAETPKSIARLVPGSPPKNVPTGRTIARRRTSIQEYIAKLFDWPTLYSASVATPANPRRSPASES